MIWISVLQAVKLVELLNVHFLFDFFFLILFKNLDTLAAIIRNLFKVTC